jgi:hypothetical protein
LVKRDAQVLHDKAISSITVATSAFNSPTDTGRVTQVLLGVQHAFEMLLKAGLVQNRVNVFNKKDGRSIGMGACVNQAEAHPAIKLTKDEAGTIRTIDAMRDDEQHWFAEVSEQILYLHTRAAITLFDELLDRVFGERLATFLPNRVLPVSTEAPKELTLLLDDEFTQIAELLKPGRCAREQARARVRTLLAMEAHNEPDTRVSDKDVARVEKGILAGKERSEVFPKLEGMGTEVSGAGVNVSVHFNKKGQGAPVRFVSDDSEDAAGVREVDLHKKYHRTPTQLANDVELTLPISGALRSHLAIDKDPNCSWEFVFGKTKYRGYSDNAFRLMRDAKKAISVESVWAFHNPRWGKKDERCSVKGCRAGIDPLPTA